ncbi:MAG: Lar family restriction alleviation protein [Synergistaceae bacterium]|nr:Lar family restriction alleviation protein [Synergistaceae bacterium]
MNESEVKLKHCPFCGGAAKIGSTTHNFYSVYCVDCNGQADFFNTKQDAAEAWNRRV